MTQTLPSDFLAALKDTLGPQGWTQDPDVLSEHAQAWRGFIKGDTPIVAKPASTEERIGSPQLQCELLGYFISIYLTGTKRWPSISTAA